MKYSTAVKRLRTVADDLSSQPAWWEGTISEAYVYGRLLDIPEAIDWISLVFVIDLPVERVTWLARPPETEALARLLRFNKYPISWQWRPSAWPVWNHEITDAVRIWSKSGGVEEANLVALAERRVGDVQRSRSPNGDALRAQLRIEVEAARRHLELVLDSFHDRDWRRDHKGDGVYPEDHLWWATRGFLDLDNAANRV